MTEFTGSNFRPCPTEAPRENSSSLANPARTSAYTYVGLPYGSIPANKLKCCDICSHGEWWRITCPKCKNSRRLQLAEERAVNFTMQCPSCGHKRDGGIRIRAFLDLLPDAEDHTGHNESLADCKVCKTNWWNLDCHCRERLRIEKQRESSVPWSKACEHCKAPYKAIYSVDETCHKLNFKPRLRQA